MRELAEALQDAARAGIPRLPLVLGVNDPGGWYERTLAAWVALRNALTRRD